MHGAILSRGKGFACPFAELDEVLVLSSLQPLQVLLAGSTTHWHLSQLSQFVLSAGLQRVHSVPLSR